MMKVEKTAEKKIEKKIAVLTYNVKHRKTYDTLCLLRAKGYKDITVFAQPLTYQKKKYPLVKHRPDLVFNIPEPAELCENLGYEYIEGVFTEIITPEYKEYKESVFLLCGAGLLPDSFIAEHRIVNSHPGFIPLARGLDSYKWSLYYDLPVGVTTHFLGKYVDGGEVIERREIKAEAYDTFHSLAQRVYENEIDMLVNALLLLDAKHEFIIPDEKGVESAKSAESARSDGTHGLFRRMPEDKELELIERFGIGQGFGTYGNYGNEAESEEKRISTPPRQHKDNHYLCFYQYLYFYQFSHFFKKHITWAALSSALSSTLSAASPSATSEASSAFEASTASAMLRGSALEGRAA